MIMAASKFAEKSIKISDEKVPVLIIENKCLFRNILLSFEDGEEDEFFTFSEDFKPFDFSKNGIFISDVVNVDLNNKKLLSKINRFLEENSNIEFVENVERIKYEMICLGDKLIEFTDFDCEYDYDIATEDIIKILKFKIGSQERIPIDNFISFMRLTVKYLKVKFFVVPHLHLMFDIDELSLIYESIALEHIGLLSLECLQPKEKLQCEEYIIIDKTLCVIDNSFV